MLFRNIVPASTMVFENYAAYQDRGSLGDRMWNAMMASKLSTVSLDLYASESTDVVFLAVGAGYMRVPNPRIYDMPPSRPGDEEGTEIYATSISHQLHCLAGLYPSLNVKCVYKCKVDIRLFLELF